MQSSRTSNYLSIQKDQISVAINSPTQMFRPHQFFFLRQEKLKEMITKGRADVKICVYVNFLNFLLTGNHSKPSNISRVISRIYCVGQEMHSGCLGSWFKGRSYPAWSQIYYLVKCHCRPCSKEPSVTAHSNGSTLILTFSSWHIRKTSQACLQFRYKPAWTASNQEKLSRELIASDRL